MATKPKQTKRTERKQPARGQRTENGRKTLQPEEDDARTGQGATVNPARAAEVRKDPDYDSQSERPRRNLDPGSLDEETLSSDAPFNQTYGLEKSKNESSRDRD